MHEGGMLCEMEAQLGTESPRWSFREIDGTLKEQQSVVRNFVKLCKTPQMAAEGDLRLPQTCMNIVSENNT